MSFAIELGTQTDLGACACCGSRTRVVHGFVWNDEGARAVYVVRWAPGRTEHPAIVALSIGAWGGAPASARRCFVFEHLITDRPGFVAIDGPSSSFAAQPGILGELLTREAALQSPLKNEAFQILDAVGVQDHRLNDWWLDSNAS